MQTEVIVSVAYLAPSEVIESIEASGDVRVVSYKIVNSVGYFTVEETDEFYGEDNEEVVVWNAECRMCGSERLLNHEGYCSRCWEVWSEI